MTLNLLKVAIRQQAVYVPQDQLLKKNTKITKSTAVFIRNLQKIGYTVSEDLLHALNNVQPTYKLSIYNMLKEIYGLNLNWAPLVKGWDKPTGESRWDHYITGIINLFAKDYPDIADGQFLRCGHLIAYGTFPLERYNGCPFCGTPFELSEIEHFGQGSKLKVLDLWTETQLNNYFSNLLQSRTALDATQADSVILLMQELPLPHVEVIMKETAMLIIDQFVKEEKYEQAQIFFKSPQDILRYLWYKQTGFLQIVQPKTIMNREAKNHTHIAEGLDQSKKAEAKIKLALKLKYNRKECRMAATWLNNLSIDTEQACEAMHSKRGMWVRFIRALRLAEYAKKEGFEYLRELLDVFYNQKYTAFEGQVSRYRLRMDAEKTFELLKQRPGLFARSLFANMLWFGDDVTLDAFKSIRDKVPMRLLLTLSMYADTYFNKEAQRIVRPLGGNQKRIATNKLLGLYTPQQLQAMQAKIEELSLTAIADRFKSQATENKTMYIDPQLFNIPLPIGDRSETIQDASSTLTGTRFQIEGRSTRLFMQWGKDLPAQHLDMDLSCKIIFQHSTEVCSYYQLTATGAKHSGDIRSIPDKVGTAEYIELDLHQLEESEAKYVVFTCNAYSHGEITPNLVVGWMNSANKMEISEASGVAYDPSTVQHMVRISSSNLSKGLVFGVLDVAASTIIWLEMAFGGQFVGQLDAKNVESLIAKLSGKTSIGNLLTIKAKAQHIAIIDSELEADETYTLSWAKDTAAVTQLFID